MVDPHGDRVDFVTAELDERIARHHQLQKLAGSTMPDDIDIAVCKILAKVDDLPYFQVRKSDVTLYEEVAMCGYPRESQSLNFTTAYVGIRLSPVTIRQDSFNISCRQFSSPKWISNRYNRHGWL
jgi:hypothetical protein